MKRHFMASVVSSLLVLGVLITVSTSGADAKSAVNRTFVVSSPFNDEFNGPALGSQWEWYHEDPTKWSLTASPGYLRIIGTNCDMYKTCANTKNLLLQKMPSGDFVMETKLKITPTINYQQGGLLIFKDLDNYLRLGLLWNTTTQGGLSVEFLLEKNGRPVNEPDWPYIKITSSSPAFLKIVKSGTVFTGHYSSDGERWTQVGTWDAPQFSGARIGLFAFANNCRGDTPEIPVDFDYFRLSLGESR